MKRLSRPETVLITGITGFVGSHMADLILQLYPECRIFGTKRWHLSSLKNEFIDTGKVKFVFRDFPFNYPALAGSMIVSCVPNEVRYEYMNALYKLQKSWVFKDIAKTIFFNKQK